MASHYTLVAAAIRPVTGDVVTSTSTEPLRELVDEDGREACAVGARS